MKSLTYLLVCLFISIGVATAQTVKVTGSVISGDDNEPVIGASIVVKGTTVGTVTNFDGTFSLDVPSGAKTLVVSYVGMTQQSVAVSPVVHVVLKTDTRNLDEVVVTAMGLTREKKALGYALQEVKSDELTKAGQLNVATSLSGKVAGVQITSQGGQVGASQNIVVRGNSSFGNNQPLIVVDGIPIANDNATGATINLGSGMNDINPEDIETISVLKGGSAALYGMRAGNGVIIITTKSGKKDKGVSISYNGDITMDQVYNLPKLQNKYGQGYYASEYDWKEAMALDEFNGSYQDFALSNGYNYLDGMGNGVNDNADESWGPRLDAGLNLPQYNSPVINGVRQATPWVSRPDNIKNFFQTGYSMNHTVSLAAATEKTSTRASLSFRDQKGTTPNTDQKRYAMTINTKMTFNKYIDFDLSANYIRTKSANLPGTGYESTNVLQSIMQWCGRQVDLDDLKNNWAQKDELGRYTHYNWIQSFHANPYWTLYKNTNSYDRNRFYGKTSLWVKPTDWLKFEGRMGLDHYDSNQFSRVLWNIDFPDGKFRSFDRAMTEFNADVVAYFNKNVGDWAFNALAGANYRDYETSIMGTGADELTAEGVFTVANAHGTPYTLNDHERRRSNSVYANASFGFKNMAYVDISVRNDWDSTIKDAFFYPSFSGSWILTETFPVLRSATLDFLKLRGGWAKIGSATDAYRSNAYYSLINTSFNGTTLFYNPITLPPAELRPESVKTWEVGLEANLFNNRLHLDGAYYSKTTTDQIMNANVATSTGYNSMYINAGEVSNKGVELQISGDIFKNPKGFSWTATLNWAKDKSRINELYTDPTSGQKLDAYQIGSSWSVKNYAMVGKSWGTLVGTGYVYNDDGSIQVEDGIPVYEAGLEIGDVTPKWMAGFNNEFSYKDWSLGFLLDFRLGGDVYSITQAFGSQTGILEHTAESDLRENGVVLGQNYMTDKVFKTKDGKINDVTVNAEDFFYNYYTICEMSVFDGSYLKLREAHITYNFPKSILEKTKCIKAAHVSLVGTNLALLWVHKSNIAHIDPESTSTGGDDPEVTATSRGFNSGVGFESNSYPPSRSFGLKFGVTF